MVISVLHSHSRIERELEFPKHMVLVDEEYGHLFKKYIPFKYRGVSYYKVPIMEFVENGGIFKR
jgi:hypothetical protein